MIRVFLENFFTRFTPELIVLLQKPISFAQNGLFAA